jgi:hypothetical protein
VIFFVGPLWKQGAIQVLILNRLVPIEKTSQKSQKGS